MGDNRLKIFVSAYACEPGLGSEIGVGWHWVLEMSKYFDLWVLTRESNRSSIEGWLKDNAQGRDIHFLYYDLPKKLRFWKKGMRGVRTYYMLWQCLTDRIVKRTMREEGIEIYHLLTYGNALWPASRYGQKRFFIWGPVGVGSTVPREFSVRYIPRHRCLEMLQRIMAGFLKWNIGYNRRCRNATLILCKTDRGLEHIPRRYRHKAVVFTDVAVEFKNNLVCDRNSESSEITYLSAGGLSGWRGFDILIEAFARAAAVVPHIRLKILGEGRDKQRLRRLIEDMGMEGNISLCGQVPMERYYEEMVCCDVVVNPSLREGAVTFAFDSMALGKPLICIDSGGYTNSFDDKQAVIIKLSSREQTIDSMCAGIISLTQSDVRKRMGKAAADKAVMHDWEHKGKDIYTLITDRYEKGRK